MGSYQDAAVEAARWTGASPSRTPVEGWRAAVARSFPESATSRNKGCPRGAFLGLCEEGFVIGVSRGHYTRSKKNKAYAVAGVQLLFREPELAGDILGLWRRVIRGEGTVHNHQMDVVIGLWNAGLIARSSNDIT